MRIRASACASFALALFPTSALAAAVVTASISAPPGGVAAGAQVQVTCWAEGRPAGGGMLGSSTTSIASIAVAVSGGTVSQAVLTGAVSAPCSQSASATCSLLQGTVTWTTPSTPGTLTATCTAAYTTTPSYGAPTSGTVASSGSITTVAAAVLPPVVSPMTGPGELVVGASAAFEVSASDPNDPPQPLSYAWTTTGGTVTPDPANGASATWAAPDLPGAYEVRVAVSNGTASSTAFRSVNVALAIHQADLHAPVLAPRRLAASDSGALFVVDGKQGETGLVGLLTARGDARGFAVLPEPALAATYGAGALWVTTARGNVYRVDPATGRTLGKVALADGPFSTPTGIAYDPTRMRLWVADAMAGRVRVVQPDGTTVATLTAAGGAPLDGALDVAVDGASGRAWVLRLGAKKETYLAAGETIAMARFLHAFDLDARYLGSFVPMGSGAGQLSRAGGLAVGAGGRVYVSDTFQGSIRIFDSSGGAVGSVGTFGADGGRLTNPTGLALMANGDLAVANTTLGRVERFGGAQPLPTCPGDGDCDGHPDAWEIAHGLDPSWAGDALLDPDADGLNDAEEYALGTDPTNRDTDGDGYSDQAEKVAGYDPTDPNDHRPVVSASGPGESTPGLVRMSAVASGNGTCTLQWRQVTGPTVTLNGPSSGSPSFVARAAGAYAFEAVASCGGVASVPARVEVAVRDVPPLVDPGRIVVARPGSLVRLDALASSDANGDVLSFAWDQTLGPPLTGTEPGGSMKLRPRGAGLYAFQVTVSDPAGASSTAEVPVLVAAGPAPTAVAAALPAEAEAGAAVILDASASLSQGPPSFAWSQVAGPQVSIAGADQGVASFVASRAGRYAFEVVVGEGRVVSPPARVEVFVAEAGSALPTVSASAPSVVAVNGAAALEAVGTGPSALSYEWRQLSGPAAGLTEADRASATAVPFSPGFYVFEVSARAGAAESRPARVAFEARAGGAAIPVARASAPTGDAVVGQLVFLDARASTGAARFRWTQVAGPWVALGGQTAVTTFRPLDPGLYAFELEVDDGAIRSAPARVEVDVAASQEVQP